jgi:aspartate aminotransferase
VLLPVPYWVTYPEQAKLVEAVPVPVTPGGGLKVTPADLEAVRTPRTRMLVFNSPNNPSGCVYTRTEVEALTAWCLEHEVILLSDEIYDRLVYDGVTATSPASLSAEAAAATITVNGASKAFAMTGWRIGFLTAPAPVTAAILKFQGQTTGNPAAVSQAAALAALEGPREAVETMRRAYEHRRNLTVEALRSIPGVELEPPHGAFYAFPRVAEAVGRVGGSLALAERLVEAGVGLVPGVGFGADDHIRISFAVAEDRLVEGLRRFRQGLESSVR